LVALAAAAVRFAFWCLVDHLDVTTVASAA
jgi:hypothetical protein